MVDGQDKHWHTVQYFKLVLQRLIIPEMFWGCLSPRMQVIEDLLNNFNILGDVRIVSVASVLDASTSSMSNDKATDAGPSNASSKRSTTCCSMVTRSVSKVHLAFLKSKFEILVRPEWET